MPAEAAFPFLSLSSGAIHPQVLILLLCGPDLGCTVVGKDLEVASWAADEGPLPNPCQGIQPPRLHPEAVTLVQILRSPITPPNGYMYPDEDLYFLHILHSPSLLGSRLRLISQDILPFR